jgi:hypothetical protein
MATYIPFLSDNSNDVSGAYYPQDFSLNALNFITVAKEKFDLKKLVSEFCYYEDIYSFCASGYITLMDAQGFIEMMRLTGNEFIEVNPTVVNLGKPVDFPSFGW